MPLGNPTEQTPFVISDVIHTVTVAQGIQSVEFVNMGSNDVYYGSSTVTSARGGPIYSGGDRRTFENIPSGWLISFICASGKSTTLRQINYV